MKSFIPPFVLLFIASWADAPQIQMHRLQATTKDASGSYLATSTQGSFSVLIPIPFNDFTVIVDDPKFGKVKTHSIGAKTAEGIKFAATELPLLDGRSPTKLSALADQFKKPGQTVSDIDTSPFADYPSVSFSVKDESSGAYLRYVKTPKNLVMVILEYPIDQAKTADGIQAAFLSSLKITKNQSEKPVGATIEP